MVENSIWIYLCYVVVGYFDAVVVSGSDKVVLCVDVVVCGVMVWLCCVLM